MTCHPIQGFPGGSDGEESACVAGGPGLIPGSRRPFLLEKEMATPSRLLAWEIPWMWQVAVHRVAKSWTRPKRLNTNAIISERKQKIMPPWKGRMLWAGAWWLSENRTSEAMRNLKSKGEDIQEGLERRRKPQDEGLRPVLGTDTAQEKPTPGGNSELVWLPWNSRGGSGCHGLYTCHGAVSGTRFRQVSHPTGLRTCSWHLDFAWKVEWFSPGTCGLQGPWEWSPCGDEGQPPSPDSSSSQDSPEWLGLPSLPPKVGIWQRKRCNLEQLHTNVYLEQGDNEWLVSLLEHHRCCSLKCVNQKQFSHTYELIFKNSWGIHLSQTKKLLQNPILKLKEASKGEM